ncbi:hypothetical protein [Aeromicrobium sp.]|uniref:hypothetical protein n=1 Tax=Aeromicrobium sp. TaxID=1871063 RepID=UPI002FC92548
MSARRAAMALPVLITLLVGAAIGGLVITQNQRQDEQVANAEAIGRDYLSAAADFQAGVAKAIKAADSTKLDEITRALDSATAKPPKLPSTSAYGRQNSSTYREAIDVRSTLLGPYKRLGRQLKEAKVAERFIAEARKLLEMRATDYVGASVITSSGVVRSRLIPAFANARDAFDAVPVPKGQERLAATIHDAAQYVVDQATLLANRIDDRKSFSFSYAAQFQAAADALNDYGTTIEGDVTEAVNVVIQAG